MGEEASIVVVHDELRRYDLPFWELLVSRGGEVVRHEWHGVAPGQPYRLYSMTKPITSAAAVLLAREGALDLDEPVARHLPAFAGMRVWPGVPARSPITVRHLLQHTAGLSYGAFLDHPVDDLYRERGFGSPPRPRGLAAFVDELAELPLLFEPGTRWNYGFATDVLGRVLEVVRGAPLDEVLGELILRPLGMTETTFRPATAVPLHHLDGRVTYTTPLEEWGFLSGGGGLVGTMRDYHRFAHWLLTTGLLRPSGDLVDLAEAAWATPTPGHYDGRLFGLGVTTWRTGGYGWSGAAGTTFAVDPWNDAIVIFLTQVLSTPYTKEITELLTSSPFPTSSETRWKETRNT